MLLGILNAQASGGAFTYWLATLGGAGYEVGRGSSTDTDGNFYAFGQTSSQGAGSIDFLLAKYDALGAVQWQRVLGGTGGDSDGSLAIDSADNLYLVGETASDGEGSDDFLIAKYNSSGTIQWQRVLGGASIERATGIAIDSSDNLLVVGHSYSAGAGDFDVLLAKYNSSGTIQWQRTLGGTGTERGNALAIDSADNVYVFGETASSGEGQEDFLIAKYNSAGTLQWQRTLGGSSGEDGFGIAFDSDDNLYVTGRTSSQGVAFDDLFLAKFNSSGTVQWQRVLGGSQSDTGNSVAVDSSNNVYVLGTTTSTGEGSDDYLLAKYNSTGVIQYQRVIGGTGAEFGNSIVIDSSDTMYLVGVTQSTGEGNSSLLIAKLPSDGSLTGTYELDGVNIVYAASTLTGATATLTAATSSLTAATSSLTSSTSTLTSATSTLTSHFVEIPA